MRLDNWFGKLPSSWEARRLKYAAPLQTQRAEIASTSPDYVGLENIQPWTGKLLRAEVSLEAQTDNEPEAENAGSAASAFQPGDVLFGKLRPYLAKVLLASTAGGCSTELLVLRPSEAVLGRYLQYTLLTPALVGLVDSTAFGAKMPRADWNTIGNIKVPLPTVSEQNRIAAYLDAETARIDALIAEKQRMLALLDEKRQALISQAVTQGLNPDAPMKPSGQDWLGNIPAHWNLVRMKFLVVRIDQGRSPEAYNQPAQEWEWGVLKTSCVNRGVFDELENKALPDSYDPDPATQVLEGDVLMSRASGSPSLLGSVAKVTTPPYTRLMLSDKTFRLSVNAKRMVPDFLVLSMAAPYARAQIENAISGAEGLANNISKESINELLLLSPPPDEQETLLRYVTTASEKLQILSKEVQLSADLLRERRSTIVADAVTGSRLVGVEP